MVWRCRLDELGELASASGIGRCINVLGSCLLPPVSEVVPDTLNHGVLFAQDAGAVGECLFVQRK